MDNNIFRSAIGGFNRQDVLAYIERFQKQTDETTRSLEAEVAELRRELSEVRVELEERTQEKDDLSRQLEDMAVSLDKARDNWNAQSQAKEAFRRDLTERDAAIQGITEEKQRLQRRVEEMESQMEDLRRQKEQLTQMELDARQRANDMVSAAEAKAEDILAQAQTRADAAAVQADALAEEIQSKAKAQAETVIAEAEERSASLRQQARKLLGEAVVQYDGFFQTFQETVGSVASEIQKLEAAARLPEGFDKVAERLAALREQTEKNNDLQKEVAAAADRSVEVLDGGSAPSEKAAGSESSGGMAVRHRHNRRRKG